MLTGYSTAGVGGIEATRRLIEAHPDMRVVLIGVMDGPERLAKARESGAMGYDERSHHALAFVLDSGHRANRREQRGSIFGSKLSGGATSAEATPRRAHSTA